MVGRDVEQDRDVAIEAEGQVDLIARQFENVDAAGGQRFLAEDRQADIAAHHAGVAGMGQDVVDQRRRRRFAIGAGDADDTVRRQRCTGLREQFDVADDRDAGGLCAHEQRRAVRHPGRYDQRIERSQVDFMEVGQFAIKGFARCFAIVPVQADCARRRQRRHSRLAAAGKPVDAIGFPGKGGAGDHRSFNVARPASASTMEIIQNRMTTVDSAQPNCSK